MNKDHLFRVSLKAVIKNERGETLIVKEKGQELWSLPGGGMDWNETYAQAIQRELNEEVGYKGTFTMKLIAADEARQLKNRNQDTRQICLIYEVRPKTYDFVVGVESDDINWVKAQDIQHAQERYSHLIHTYCI